MLNRILLFIVLACLAGFGLQQLYAKTYPYVLASEEARSSLTVTDAQSAELQAAARASDMVAFAFMGMAAGGIVAVCFSNARAMSGRATATIAGLILGGAAGAATGWLGHWFQGNPALEIQDPMMHALARWFVMLLPIAVVTGIAVSIGGSAQSIGMNVVAAMFGIVAAAAIYAFLSGLVTAAEERHKILPVHDGNRLIIAIATIGCIGIAVFFQQRSAQKAGEKSSSSPANTTASTSA